MTMVRICPSMMCADFRYLKDEVESLDRAGADIFHMDIMDGQFVPNFGMGLQDYELVRKTTNKLMDVHLMIQNPAKYVELFANLGANIIYFHPEADSQPARTIEMIRNLGVEVGLALNPGTSVATVSELLKTVDFVLVMTVNPGFAGQKYLDYVDDKINDLCALKVKYHFELTVDGAISAQKIDALSKVGIDNFVLGTSGLFGKKKKYRELITEYKGA